MMSIGARLRVWRRALGGGRGEADRGASEARDERLSAYLDGDWSATETPALQSDLAADPELASALSGMRQVRDALAALGEVRAPRPFTLEAVPAPPAASRLELASRVGAAAAAVALVVVLIGDASTFGDGVDAPVPALAELASAPTAADELAVEASSAEAQAAPTVADLAAPAARAPAGADATGAAAADEEDAAEAPAPPAEAPERSIAPAADGGDGTLAVQPGGGALRPLKIVLAAATLALGVAAAAQWARRRRS